MAKRHLIGLLLAVEESWPRTFDAVLQRLGPVRWEGETHEFATERILNEAFDLRSRPPYALVIDRLAWWYVVPREWLKKMALMDDVYLLNNPFTFQAMEKHAAYCAMIRLGLDVPETWLIPHKLPPDDPRFARMAERYYGEFDLDGIAGKVGYPLFMKPFDGGAWVGVTRVSSPEELHASYDASGERLMHLQAAVEDYDVFTRSLSIGPQTVVAEYEPAREYYERYAPNPDLAPELHREIETISRLVNAFFRWELNSCEVIVKGGRAQPIDYANASPDLSLVGLNYLFPWAIKSLIAWCAFCCLTGRGMQINQNLGDYLAIADDEGLSYEEKLERYRTLADEYFDSERFEEFVATALPSLDEHMVDYIESAPFDDVLVHVVQEGEPPELHERLITHCREQVATWAADRRALG